MRKLLLELKRDENGMILSAELVLVVTIGVLGMIVGLNAVATSINSEMNDIASAFGAINQSYSYQGMTKWGHATVVGSGYIDAQDYCDCSVIVPTVGVTKFQGLYGTAPRTYVPHHGHHQHGHHAHGHHAPKNAAPCDNCPHGAVPHKLTPKPDHLPHKHPHPKHAPKKPHRKGPKLKK